MSNIDCTIVVTDAIINLKMGEEKDILISVADDIDFSDLVSYLTEQMGEDKKYSLSDITPSSDKESIAFDIIAKIIDEYNSISTVSSNVSNNDEESPSDTEEIDDVF